MTTRDGWNERPGGPAAQGQDISGWETRATRPGVGGAGGAYRQAEPPLPPELSPRGPGARRSPQQPAGYRTPSAQAGSYQSAQQQGGQSYESSSGTPSPPGLNPRGPGRGKGGGSGTGTGGGRRWSRGRKIRFTLFALVLTLLAVSVGTFFWADSKINHSNVLVDYAGRPAAGKGSNWLILGSDSRQGLTQQQMDQLHTGFDTGARTDSMMLLHTGGNGNTLMSIPRDSYVTIPAWTDSKGVSHRAAKHKINAAFAEGGGPLLVQTLEFNTGIHIDHYAEIGFSGFVNVVNDLGGIDLCLDKAIVDKASGANLKAGCETLNGAQSLAFVRERHQEATQDLARMQHQQQFLAALSHKATSMGTLLDPFTLYPTLNSGLSMLTVDNNTGLTDLGSMFFAMKDVKSGNGKTVTVPIAAANLQTPADGVAVKWNMTEAQQIFDAFKNDTTVPTFSN